MIIGYVLIGSSQDAPLKAVQMIWVNLLQDTLASLSLATEQPTDELLKRKPYARHQSILSMTMLNNIVVHSAYQLFVLFYFLFAGRSLLPRWSFLSRDS